MLCFASCSQSVHQRFSLQGRSFDFEDGDVYMSSHEHRFRMFSSVEYEGQLYMTPQNFIESVTMSEPRSTYRKQFFAVDFKVLSI